MIASLLEQDFARLVVLACVQGLTEFLPVSSSGHLVLSQALLGGFQEHGIVVEVALHLGTLAAVLFVYRGAVGELLSQLARGTWRESAQIVVATIPAAVVGLTLEEQFEEAFRAPRLAGIGLFVTAIVLLLGEAARRRNQRRANEDTPGATEPPTAWPGLSWKQAILIGLAQALAVWPGISRSGSTIAMGIGCGLAPAHAARFSFLLSIPAIAGASILHLPDALAEGVGGGPATLLAAMTVAALVGYAALRFLLSFLGRGAFAWFALYCVLLASAAFFV